METPAPMSLTRESWAGMTTNERLRTALLQRAMTPAALAEAVDVDPKTIERWLAGRAPYRKHRYKVAALLGIDETYLWPGGLAAEQMASASESEIIVVHPHRWAVPRDTWGLVFDSAEYEIGVLVYAGLFLADDPGIVSLFQRKAEQGVRVRILVGDPDSPDVATRGDHEGIGESMASKIRNALVLYRPLRDVNGVEIRMHATPLYNSIYRADGDVLVNPHIYRTPAAQAPVLHLRQIAGGTLVQQYLTSFEQVWSESRPID